MRIVIFIRRKGNQFHRQESFHSLIYAGYSCTQGWFCTPCTASPQLRGLKNILRLYIKKVNCSEWELVPMPSRQVVDFFYIKQDTAKSLKDH
nr:unnamed protein product [Digitaria exilis]